MLAQLSCIFKILAHFTETSTNYLTQCDNNVLQVLIFSKIRKHLVIYQLKANLGGQYKKQAHGFTLSNSGKNGVFCKDIW